MSPETNRNLRTAMEAEAFAYAKFARFAACARMHEDLETARVFQSIADAERTHHFSMEADLASPAGSDIDNLRDAIADISKQIKLYEQFAEQAATAGDSTAAETFVRIRQDELSNLRAFTSALKGLTDQAAHGEMPASAPEPASNGSGRG
jgi:rubrerythrin